MELECCRGCECEGPASRSHPPSAIPTPPVIPHAPFLPSASATGPPCPNHRGLKRPQVGSLEQGWALPPLSGGPTWGAAVPGSGLRVGNW